MKVHKLGWPIFSLCAVLTVGLTACEEKSEAEPEATKAEETQKAADANAAAAKAKEAPPPPKEPAIPPPAEACTSLVNALKAKDEAKVAAMSTAASAEAMNAEGAKEHLMTTLAAATCGAAKVEGDGATVAVTAGDAAQDVSFVKAKDGWKFDAAAYLTKYPPTDKHGKGKAKGKDHGAKAKGAKGKKHKK